MHLKSRVLLLVLLCTPTFASAEMTTVRFSGAELRSQPSAMTSSVVAATEAGAPLEIIEQGNEYVRVRDYRGRSGWVHRSLLGGTPGIVVTAGSANVRLGPGTGHSVAFQMKEGETATQLEKKETWIRLRTGDGREGWIADFLVWGD